MSITTIIKILKEPVEHIKYAHRKEFASERSGPLQTYVMSLIMNATMIGMS